jgi:sigma-B regulation protein RsbU (phosphoserine phosphatase)
MQANGKLSQDESRRHDAVARKNGWHRFEWTHQKANGQLFPVEVTLNAIKLNGEDFTLVVWHDLTLQKRYEEEILAKSEALKAANTKLNEDLQAAALVQRSLLPAMNWQAPGLESGWVYSPSEQLGGDILNIFHLEDGVVGFYCLDVTGHGVAASLLAVTASHLLSPASQHSLVNSSKDTHVAPREVLTRLNREFPYRDGVSRFMTITYGVIHVTQKKMTFACAGHPGPILVKHDGNVHRLDHPGFPIGILSQVIYEEHELALEAGDRIYVYSDGVPEAQSPDGQFFEVNQLLSSLSAFREDDLSRSVEQVNLAVERWCAPARARDDISLMGFQLTTS